MRKQSKVQTILTLEILWKVSQILNKNLRLKRNEKKKKKKHEFQLYNTFIL